MLRKNIFFTLIGACCAGIGIALYSVIQKKLDIVVLNDADTDESDDEYDEYDEYDYDEDLWDDCEISLSSEKEELVSQVKSIITKLKDFVDILQNTDDDASDSDEEEVAFDEDSSSEEVDENQNE